MNKSETTLCVVGASGFAGSHIVRAALDKGYRVNGTLRDKDDAHKAPYLKALPGGDQLILFSGDMSATEDFDAPLAGADAVFIACLIPTYKGPSGTLAREMEDEQGYAEIIMPTVNGCLNIMEAAKRQGVKNVIICSSTSSTNPIPPVEKKNEIDHWSDEKEQCRAKKYTSATKTIMEKAAMKFAEENGMRLSILLPTGMFGPVILPEHMERYPHAWIRGMLNGESPRHAKMPDDSMSLIHLHDLADLFLAAYENANASGRYFGVYDSWHWQDIYAELENLIPGLKVPAPLDVEPAPPTGFDFSRRDSLGVTVRDIPTILRDTVEWIRSEPFG